MLQECNRHHRLRSVYVKFFGQYFLKELPMKEVEEHHRRNIIYIDSLKSEQDVADLAAREQMIRDPLDTL